MQTLYVMACARADVPQACDDAFDRLTSGAGAISQTDEASLLSAAPTDCTEPRFVTAFGEKICEEGSHVWMLKIQQTDKPHKHSDVMLDDWHPQNIVIGVRTFAYSSAQSSDPVPFWETQSDAHVPSGSRLASVLTADACGFGYDQDGRRCHNKTAEPYGLPFGEGDLIEVSLDLHNKTLSFKLNNIDLGVCYQDLPLGMYCLAVSMRASLQESRNVVCLFRQGRVLGVAPEVEKVIEINERLFTREEGKDVTFRLQDGEERAHKLFLSVASEVFDRMFAHDMREGTTGVVSLMDVNRVSMRVFLRLLYTGRVQPADWETYDGSNQIEDKRMPLNILLDVASLSQKYTVSSVSSTATQALMGRLCQAQRKNEVQTFLDIFAAAIMNDLTEVRMAALDIAREFGALRTRYGGLRFEARELYPQVCDALEAIWFSQK